MEVTLLTSRRNIYLSTLLTFFGVFYFVGVIATTKEPMGVELNLSSSFLGLLDGIFFIGATLGSLLTAIFPLKKPVTMLIFLSFCLVGSLEIQLFCVWFPFYTDIILLLSRLLFGISFVSAILAQSIVNHSFNRSEDQGMVQIWFALGGLGDLFGILFCSFFMETLGLGWKLSMTCCGLIFVILSLYFFQGLSSIDLEEEQNRVSKAELQGLFRKLLQYWGHGLNIIHTIMFITFGSMYYLAILWLPYYFLTLGFETQASLISVVYPLAYTIGTVLTQPILTKIKEHVGVFFLFMMIISTITSYSLLYLGNSKVDIPYYYTLIFIAAMSYSGFYSYTFTTDQRNRTANSRDFMIINSTNLICLRFTQGLNATISGVLVEADIHGFIKYYTLVSFVCTVLTAVRIRVYPESYKEKQQKKMEKLIFEDYEF